MVASRRGLSLALLILSVSVLSAAVPPARPPARPLDLSKLPPGTIFLIGDDAKDVLQQPGIVVLTPEKFKELLDQIDQLKKQVTPDKPDTPSRCKLNGRVEGDLVHLQAVYEFETRRRKAQVTLGCQKAWPTGATLDDGRLPLLPPPGEDGFVVQVENPGQHRLTLELELPVTVRGAKGSERGFELGLPRAAITLIESLDVPDYVRDLRFGTRQIAAKDVSSRNGQRKVLALGPVDKLDVSWKGPTPQSRTDPLLTAQGQLDVRVDDTHITTEADLVLQVQNNSQAGTWQVQAPPPPLATLELDLPANDERAPVVTPPAADAKNPVWTIKLKEPSAEPLRIRLRVRQQRTGKPMAIGPFAVLGAVRQHGSITISVPPELRTRYRTRGDVSQREVPEDLRRGNVVAVFAYWSLPPAEKGVVPAPLDIEVETARGVVETSVNHVLKLTDAGWQVTTEIDVKPERAVVDRLEVELPADYEVKATSALPVDADLEIKEPAKPRIGIVKLVGKQSRPFKVSLVGGLYPVAEGARSAVVPLPRPLGTIDRGGKVTVSVPEGIELVKARDSALDGSAPDRRDHTWRPDRAPSRVDIAWRRYRPEVNVEIVSDVTLTERQARVRQRLVFQSAQEPLKEVVLRAADFPQGRAPIGERATLTPLGAGRWSAPLKEPALTLEYAFPLPEVDRSGRVRFALPLFWPEAATGCVTKVRVWSAPGVQPVLAAGPWEERPTEVVGERESLPSLVLRSAGLELPLSLRLEEPTEAPLASLALDRVLIQAALADTQQVYRARFLLTRVGARHLDVELPTAPANLANLDITLDGKRPGYQIVDEEGSESETGRIVRLRVEPELYRKPVVLEVRYLIPKSGEGNGRFQTTFFPPRLRGNVLPGRVRWQVGLPGDWLPVSVGGQATSEQRLGLRSGLPAPRPAATAVDLERWFNAGLQARPGTADEVDPVMRGAEVVCTQAVLEPLTVTHVPQTFWLLTCSLSFLIIGLTLYFAPLPRRVVVAVLALVVVAVLVAAIVWPGPLWFVAYACAPGLAVLLLAVVLQWLLQRRYQQQVVFMPGFTRLAPGSTASAGSSVARPGSSLRRRGEPSTVDAPPGKAP